jgi:hypothetical protein
MLPGDRVAYAYVSGSAGDHPPIDAVLDALRAPAGEAGRVVPAAAPRAG